MKIEEAIKTAIEYETKVRDVYVDAINHTDDEDGKRILKTLAKEEQGHLDYLKERLAHWEETGTLDQEKLYTAIPSRDAIEKGVKELVGKMKRESRDSELELMKKALAAENETSAFYRKMVDEMSAEGKELFKRFLEIEEGHLNIVQAEINALINVGYWFDFTDINLEMS